MLSHYRCHKSFSPYQFGGGIARSHGRGKKKKREKVFYETRKEEERTVFTVCWAFALVYTHTNTQVPHFSWWETSFAPFFPTRSWKKKAREKGQCHFGAHPSAFIVNFEEPHANSYVSAFSWMHLRRKDINLFWHKKLGSYCSCRAKTIESSSLHGMIVVLSLALSVSAMQRQWPS